MASITNIASSDLISDSREDINNNFTNLNNDKIETSVLDTDTTLTANSDSKVATQKAVKAYVDGVGVANASTTVRGVVEEATDAQIATGTDTGETGARLFAVPSKMARVATTQTFNSSGTWTKPTGCKSILVELWGGGQSGSSTNNNSEAIGGVGGSYIQFEILANYLGATETVMVGVGGTPVTGSNTGVNGGNTSFGSSPVFGTAPGGGTGGTASELLPNPKSESGGTGGSSTVAGGGKNFAGGGGGGIDGTSPNPFTTGGNSVFGGDGGTANATGNNGTAGTAPGGGGGACDLATSGAGANGRAVITEFY